MALDYDTNTTMLRRFDPVDHTPRVLLEIKTSRTGEETPEAMVQFLSSLTNVKKKIMQLWRYGYPISFEISVVDQRIHFYISTPIDFQNFIESQLIAQYPKSLITKVDDYLPKVLFSEKPVATGQLKLKYGFSYPLRTFRDFKDVDPLSSLLGILAKSKYGDSVAIQYLLVPIDNGWQRYAQGMGTKKTADGKEQSNPYSSVISEKISSSGFKTAIRIAVNSDDEFRSDHFLEEIANSYASFNNPSANHLVFKRPILWQKKRLVESMLLRSKFFMPASQILNVAELATLYHFPTTSLANIPNISWHKTILSDPPEMLPVAEGLNEEEKAEINFFAKTEFKNRATVFGLKKNDRRRHVYIIGKTGAGKSTLVANMAINDMRNNRGFCIIDPHGDLCETVLNFVPSYRINDVVYLDPADPDHSFAINPLEVSNPSQSELVVSGLIAVFRKLYDFSWGPRLEYILRNTLLTIINQPNATFLMIPDILTNTNFRKRVVSEVTDPVIRNFWLNEFNTMPDRMKAEALSPILNKVGQFISAKAIRNIIRHPKSTVDFEHIMNEGKILLLNLSQGKLGEDNAALLGAMSITKMQLAAMQRVNIPEAERRDFYLYVDEFQNFATSSFVKILAEARKYRLNLLLANQYIAQVPEDVRSAIFGNVGTMLSFLIGAEDTPIIAKEFSERFKEEDLLALGNHRAIIKLAIDGVTQSPFLCQTLPLPNSATNNKEKVIRISKERYTKQIIEDVVEQEPEEKIPPPPEKQQFTPSFQPRQENKPPGQEASYQPRRQDFIPRPQQQEVQQKPMYQPRQFNQEGAGGYIPKKPSGYVPQNSQRPSSDEKPVYTQNRPYTPRSHADVKKDGEV